MFSSVKKNLHSNKWKLQVKKQQKESTENRKKLNKAKKRVKDIDDLIQKIYEDNVNGKISDKRFATMSMSLEDEQRKLKESIPEMETDLETSAVKTEGLQLFIDRAKKITRLTELTPEIVHEFIEKIVVSKPVYIDGKRHQTLDIYYNGVGILTMTTPEEMEEEFEYRMNQQGIQTTKTAQQIATPLKNKI